MPGNEAFTGLRKEFLEGVLPEYEEAHKQGRSRESKTDICRRFFLRWPPERPDTWDPSPEQLAAIDDKAAAPESQTPDVSSLSEDERVAYEANVEALGKRVAAIQGQIGRRLEYRRGQIAKAASSGDNAPYAELVRLLTATSSEKPRKHPAMHLWKKANDTAVRAVYNDALAAWRLEHAKKQGPKSKDDKAVPATLFNSVAKAEYNKLSNDEKALWELKAREDHQERVQTWISQTVDFSTDPEDRQRCINGLTTFMQPILDAVTEATGWPTTFITGGPEPADAGRLNVVNLHSGTTQGHVGMTFGSAMRAQYKSRILPLFGAFLLLCFSPKDCEARALAPDASTASLATTLRELGVGGSKGGMFSQAEIFDATAKSQGPSSTQSSDAVPDAPAESNSRAWTPPLLMSPNSLKALLPHDDAPSQSSATPESGPSADPGLDLSGVSQPVSSLRPEPASDSDPLSALKPAQPPQSGPSSGSDPSSRHLPSSPEKDDVAPQSASLPQPGPSSESSLEKDATATLNARPRPRPKPKPLVVRPASPSLALEPSTNPTSQVQPPPVPDSPSQAPAPDSSSRPTSTSHITAAPQFEKRSDGNGPDADVGSVGSVPVNDGTGRKRAREENLIEDEAPAGRRTRSKVAPSVRQPKPPGSSTAQDETCPSPLPASSASGTITAKVNVPRGAPPYLQESIAAFNTITDLPLWRHLTQQWVEHEKKKRYFESARLLASKIRPAAVGLWIGQGRRWNFTAPVTDAETYGDEFANWYNKIQPTWRKEMQGEALVSYTAAPTKSTRDTWDPLSKSGPNGVLGVVAALFFWDQAIRALPAHGFREKEKVTRVRERWIAYSEDVSFVFESMLLPARKRR